jgi:glycosyltransferase involved in cell wall biosynthesis
VTSTPTARLLVADFGVGTERITVVEPGTDRGEQAPRAALASEASGHSVSARAGHSPEPGSSARVGTGTVALLAVGSIVPRKGYDVLVAALADLAELDWRLVIAGDGGRSAETFHQLVAEIARRGLDGRIAFRGAVSTEELSTLYATSDLFVLPSRFEGYGMAYTEAIAHGLPVVGTTAGAIPATVPAGAGVLVPPDDVAALIATLRRLIENPAERARLAAGARAATFPSWREQAVRFAGVLERLA